MSSRSAEGDGGGGDESIAAQVLRRAESLYMNRRGELVQGRAIVVGRHPDLHFGCGLTGTRGAPATGLQGSVRMVAQ